jgi:hypothetical protein
MKSIWNDQDCRALRARLDHLTPISAPRWGKFDAPGMVAHLTDCLRMATGELPVKSKKLPIRFTPLKQLIIYLMPFPKGAPTAPELIARRVTDWHGELETLRETLDAFAKRGPAGPLVRHPAFGELTPRAWGVLVHRHMDHHLRQFGV